MKLPDIEFKDDEYNDMHLRLEDGDHDRLIVSAGHSQGAYGCDLNTEQVKRLIRYLNAWHFAHND